MPEWKHLAPDSGPLGRYRERRRRGTRIAIDRLGAKRTDAELRMAAEVFTRRVRQLGIAPTAAIAVVTHALQRDV